MENSLPDMKLTDIIDINTLQNIQDSFAKATGLAALTVDLVGPVTNLSNGTDFCMKLTRTCQEGARRCNECDIKGGLEATNNKRPSVYYCHGGLMDFAAPILIGDKQIGSLIGGQVLPEPPNENHFRIIAKELGINENAYIEALSKIKIVSKDAIQASAELLFIMANTLSTIGYQKYIQMKLTKELYTVSKSILDQISKMGDYTNKVINTNDSLVNSFDMLLNSADKSANQVEEIDQVAKYIDEVARQTNLLGLNASIEAARAKEYGAGFSIIAKEIRKLSTTNSEQSKKIATVLQAIKSSIFTIGEQVNNTNSSINENVDALNQISNSLIEIRNSAEILKDFEKQLINVNS